MKFIFSLVALILLSSCSLPPDPYSRAFNVPSQQEVDKYPDAAKKAGIYFDEKNYEESFHYSQIAAEQGHADSQAHLGYLYKEGLGTEKNVNLAFYWYKKAAEQNQPHAEYNLGQMYSQGEVVEKNDELAKYWFGRAVNHNLGPAAVERLNDASH